jgi:hypothetical protein
MNHKPTEAPVKSGQPAPSYSEKVNNQKQKAVQREIAGRHKNTGTKDHQRGR